MLFGLFPHEHKQTVLHFTVQRNTEYEGSVRSKDPLILCVGPRRLRIRPTYSEHSRGGGKGPNNVHKFERYFRHGGTHVASTYGPVVYGKQPCMLLRESEDPQGTYDPCTFLSH
jgi:pre-rRNA-processing protein TSR1